MATLTVTVKSEHYGKSTAEVPTPSWAHATIQLSLSMVGAPDHLLIPTMTEWLRHDGSTAFTMPIPCECGGLVCDDVKELTYTP